MAGPKDVVALLPPEKREDNYNSRCEAMQVPISMDNDKCIFCDDAITSEMEQLAREFAVAFKEESKKYSLDIPQSEIMFILMVLKKRGRDEPLFWGRIPFDQFGMLELFLDSLIYSLLNRCPHRENTF